MVSKMNSINGGHGLDKIMAAMLLEHPMADG